jgi:hypothetical protein
MERPKVKHTLEILCTFPLNKFPLRNDILYPVKLVMAFFTACTEFMGLAWMTAAQFIKSLPEIAFYVLL